MAFDAHVLLVLIASPGDTIAERDAAEGALHGWNAARAVREQVILLPRRWENAVVPRLGGRPQSMINEELVDDADIVIALFDSRLGMATGEAVSGTAEEIQRAHESGKPVHVWFSEEPLPRNVDLEQFAALRQFKESLEPLGLLGSYASPDDLAFKVRQAVESDLSLLYLGPVSQRRQPAGAVLRARYEHDREPYTDNRGHTKHRTRRERIVVRNNGSVTAANVRLTTAAVEDGEPSSIWDADETPSIISGAEFSWPLLMSWGSARSMELTMTWNEDGFEKSEVQHVALT